MKNLKVTGRYLAYEDGTPFFYLADTAWELLHRGNREEIAYYLRTRAGQKFTAFQTVLLAEFEGTTVKNSYGRLPLLFTNGLPDPTKPDLSGEYSYWAHVDYTVKEAEKNGLYAVLLPTWGDKINLGGWGKGPVIFDRDNAYVYGKFLGERYRGFTNIIWMLGGDREIFGEHRRIIDAIAQGIKDAGDKHLMTFHPAGCHQSTEYVGDAAYIDFHTAQTGHATEQCYKSDEIMRKMAQDTDKPYMDSEPRYEDHPACFNDSLGCFWGQNEVRQNAYWDVLMGTCGHTYGNHSIWSMTRDTTSYFPNTWMEVMKHPGAEQMKHLRKLREERDLFSLALCMEALYANECGMGHCVAGKGKDYLYAYSPLGLPIHVKLDLFPEAKYLKALWFDPRNGEEKVFAILPAEGKTVVVPPTNGQGNDWVLILEAIL